jgi:hypothetical protein
MGWLFGRRYEMAFDNPVGDDSRWVYGCIWDVLLARRIKYTLLSPKIVAQSRVRCGLKCIGADRLLLCHPTPICTRIGNNYEKVDSTLTGGVSRKVMRLARTDGI